ncbi:Restriction endonuclease [Chromobacterium vaccinii]|nr:Restriction endonuclease [Chromobacterium vaccinii]QND88187.1 Restriction endonuclease [Chromobacterium vaccinii]
MIYQCNSCSGFSFKSSCPRCGESGSDTQIPLDPSFYQEFQYKSKGFLKDLLSKKKEVANLEELLNRVLRKYADLKHPFFTNFVFVSNFNNAHVSQIQEYTGFVVGKDYTDIELFQEVLVRNGFDELKRLPELINKLLATTLFESEYIGFSNQLVRHVSDNIRTSLESWISEVGMGFRKYLPLFLYYAWINKSFHSSINFNENARESKGIQLVEDPEYIRWLSVAEEIYYDVLVRRMDKKLRNFNITQYRTMHDVDAMSGFEFEDFLVSLFQTIGYDVKETKKTGDQGADLFVEKFSEKIVIQAKNYTAGNVGNKAVQEVLAAKSFYRCDRAMVVTNSYFTSSAKELAEATSVDLIDRDDFQNYLNDYNQCLIDKFSDNNSQ